MKCVAEEGILLGTVSQDKFPFKAVSTLKLAWAIYRTTVLIFSVILTLPDIVDFAG
jgi:hypothetical protein